MTPTRTEFQVVPTETDWEIRQDGVVLLTVQTKQVAIDEAAVQAELAKPSHVAVKDTDGEVEDEATFGDLTGETRATSRRRRTGSAETSNQDQQECDDSAQTPNEQSAADQEQAQAS